MEQLVLNGLSYVGIIEDTLRQKKILRVIGTDEAGRGPLAGPVVAAAIKMPFKNRIAGVNDSKKLSPRKRQELYPLILEACEGVAIQISSPEEIDRINILQASRLAMKKAVRRLLQKVKATHVLIDGNYTVGELSGKKLTQVPIVKGDCLSYNIACASIVAKVFRDKLMAHYHQKYPEYNFIKHKGYPTPDHLARILKYGISPIHRQTFRPVAQVIMKSGNIYKSAKIG